MRQLTLPSRGVSELFSDGLSGPDSSKSASCSFLRKRTAGRPKAAAKTNEMAVFYFRPSEPLNSFSSNGLDVLKAVVGTRLPLVYHIHAAGLYIFDLVKCMEAIRIKLYTNLQDFLYAKGEQCLEGYYLGPRCCRSLIARLRLVCRSELGMIQI